ncbi:MFS transporter [Brevibacillus humidisoli]|uniref:MFS transporter n=1 Tax=Brevibacillus humidisoli TaxID=2895522 RepID=UPI001E469901|nr:MFS transporter [Brevibacillus humidisoli]UFJ40789.1 MFS transporter [Brevibacillus humidisoli]
MKVEKTEQARLHRFSSASLPLQVPFFYGWVIVAVSALGVFFSGPGQTYTVSVFIDAYIRDFEMERTVVSGIYSAATLCAGFLLFIVGRLIDRYGRRAMAVVIGLLLGLACLFNSAVAGPITLFAGFFMLRLFGQGSMTLLPSTLVPQWFLRYRGRALSIMGLGGLIGASVFPPLNNWLFELIGWRGTWQVLGAMLILIFVPLAFLLIRNKPEDVGMLPDGQPHPDSDHQAVDKSSRSHPVVEESWTVKEAMRTRAFWFLLFCVVVPALVITGLTFQLFSILGEYGVGRTTTAFLLSFVPIVAFLAQLLSGFLVERIKVHAMLGFSFLLNIVAMLTLYYSATPAMIFVFAVLWGISQGLLSVTLQVIWPNYYGREHLGKIGSITATATVIGSAFGPIPFGWAYDHLGGYSDMILLMTLFPVAAMILAFLSPPPKKNRPV